MTQAPEAWYRPCAETDISNLTGWRLGQTPGGCNTIEFPTMEEGLLTPTVNFGRPPASGMTHSPILETADSQLSPNLPLMTTNATQGQTFFNETVFKQAGLDFAPLRATPDVSAVAVERPSAHLQISEAVQLAGRDVGPESSGEASLSQHPLAFNLTAPNNASLGSYLSQHPLTFSEPVPAEPKNWPALHADLSAKTLDHKEENSQVPRPPMWPDQPLATRHLPNENWRASPSQDFFLLDNSLPAPLLLDLLEDDMGLPKHDGFLSSGSSSCKSGLGKDPGGNVINRLTVNVDLLESAPKLTLELRQSKGQTTPPLESPRSLLDAAGKPWRRASDPETSSANRSLAFMSSRARKLSSVDSSLIPEILPTPNRQHAGEKFQSGAEEDQRKFTPAPVDSKPCASASFQPIPVTSGIGEWTEALKAILTSMRKNELTLSDGSIEREPRNTGISPFDEASFSVHLAPPIHHSTPGFWTVRNLNHEGPGMALPSQSGLQRPLSCLHEEMSKTPHADACNSSAVEPHRNPCPFPTKESFMSLGTPGLRNDQSNGSAILQPLKGRIQSMPSLNFMEKVGAWHLSYSAEKLPEMSAVPSSGTPVPGPSGVSPRRKAYDAIADSLNRILLKQQSLSDLKAAPFYGPSSMTDLHSSQNEPPPRALPFTRSQSETSVTALSREISRTDIGNETRPDDALRRADVHADSSTASRITPTIAAEEDSLRRCYKAVPIFVTVSSDEESVSTGRPLDPLIKSRRVAELLRGETSSFDGSKEELGDPEEKTRELSGCGFQVGPMRMDYFRDLSPDHLNQGTDSGTDSCTDLRVSSRQSSRSFPALSKLHSSLDDELQTSNHSELNIDERIPVYLRNLGIDQSPSSILTPFIPRGPIREIEFSPTELRTLKASSDLFRLQLSEDSQSEKDATQSTLNSSLLSGSAWAGSAVVSDTSQPAKPSPPHTRGLPHPSNSPWKPHAITPPLAASVSESPSAPISTEEIQVIPGSPSSLAKERSTVRGVSPEDNFDPNQLGTSRVKSGSSSQDNDEKPASEEIRSSSTIPGGEKEDFFTGSNAQKESQKLPAEVDPRPSSEKFRSRLSLSSSGSLKQIDRSDLSGGPGSIERSTLGIQRGWSWDESMTKQEITGSLKWEALQMVDLFNKEPMVPQALGSGSRKANEDRKMTKPITRSDPEGCTRTAVNQNVPVPTGSCPDVQASPSPNLPEIQSGSDMDDVSKLLRGFPRVEEKVNDTRPKEIGGSQESTNSSSVDSLGLRVKKLLQYGPPAIHRTPQVEVTEERDGSGPKEPSVSSAGSVFGRREVGAQGSDNGSSMDSLAVRVKTLLEEEQPVLHATQILRSVEEEEEKARAWVKLKLATEPQYFIPELTEEDRRMIERMKREQLSSSGETEHLEQKCPVIGGGAWVKLKLATEPQYFIPELTEEDRRMIERMKREQLSSSGETEHLENQQWRSTFQRLPNSNTVATVEPGSLLNPKDHDLQTALQKYGLQLDEISGENAAPATDGALTAEPEVKLARSVQIPDSGQLQPLPGNVLDSKANSHLPSDTHLRGASKAPTKEDGIVAAPLDISESATSVEAAIQITSITFASRRRSPSPASRLPRTLLADVHPRDPVSSETRPANQEQPKLDNSQRQSYQARSSAGVTSARTSVEKVAFPSPKVCPPPPGSIKVARDDPRREDLSPSLQESPRRGVEPKDLVHQTDEDKRASDPDFAEQRRYAKTLDDIYTVHPERSAALPPPKSGDVRPQNCSEGEAGSAPKPLFPDGKEKTQLREDLSTSDSYLHKPRRRGSGSTSLLHSASLDCISTAVPVSPTLPTRKALSGVHLTLSPKRVELDLSGPVDIGPEGREVQVLKPTASDVPSLSFEATSKSTESKRKTPGSSYFPREASSQDVPKVEKRALQHVQEPQASRDHVAAAPSPADAGTRSSRARDNNLKATASSQTEWMSSDAITQITTESPEKTTYSAEIFVTAENGEAPHPKSHKTPNDTMLGISKISVLDGQTSDRPLVLPYKPPSCSEVYYVPCGKETLRISRVRSETTVESSHSGSNDAVPPDFPPQALGSRKDHPSDTAIVKHKEGIYSKKAPPGRVAWMEEKAAATATGSPRGSCNGRHSLESLKTSQSGFESAQPPLKPTLQDDPHSPPGSKALGRVDAPSRGPALSPQDLLQRKGILESSPSPSPRLHLAQKEESFIPLTGEVDYSFLEEIKFKHASKRDLPDAQKASFGRASQLPSGSQTIKEKRVADLPRGPSSHRTSTLDDLWAKYLERQNQWRQLKPIESNHRTELSLVERLDRLARLLQNPVRHSLALVLEDQKEPRRKAPRLGSPREKKMASRKKVASQPSIETSEEALVGPSSAWQSKSRRPKTGHLRAVEPGDRNWDGSLTSKTPSETSSDLRPGRDASVITDVTSESEGTRIDTESATQTGTSESLSTINTARLIRAFGQERVQVSPKLSQLYSTIDLQKTRSETWTKRGKKAEGDSYPKMVHLEQKRREDQPSPSFTSSDSVSSLGSSRGPSPALSSKRMSNKAVQAGDFEIVNSGTKKHTRDVGLTFPTPTQSQATLQGGAARSRTENRVAQHHGLLAEDEEQQTWQPGGFLEGRRARRSRSQWTQGVSWFVPAADLKPDPLEESGGGFLPGPALAWSEPPPTGNPWREPLREQNWPERPGGLQVRLAAPSRDAENEPPLPLGKMTLQESLAMHRPDFISSSGERLKRLKLLVEERKLQTVFQGERERLFNPPDGRSCRNAGGLVNRGYRAIRSRAVSKNEMVERSKRIYEQLPEVRKRREEAKRKSEYSSNRLKAQLYKTVSGSQPVGRDPVGGRMTICQGWPKTIGNMGSILASRRIVLQWLTPQASCRLFKSLAEFGFRRDELKKREIFALMSPSQASCNHSPSSASSGFRCHKLNRGGVSALMPPSSRQLQAVQITSQYGFRRDKFKTKIILRLGSPHCGELY
ncbi:centrosome-associated protein ALMS1 [Ahaetulla prasina]|uniref:centrosome-associated protein ALMS1 n=1 Tax=Ahaetulla prasina TaxID=499056 RepID=UPI002649ADA0|nr:centrosome-associated protein ALMS1 [Ahaetulla prasina]